MMSIELAENIEVEDLEKILKHLPKPTTVNVGLYGSFDYSDISKQAEETVFGIKLWDPGGIKFDLESPSNEMILKIYKKPSTGNIGTVPLNKKRINLNKATWYIDRNIVEITPFNVKISYFGKEPDYVSKIREELSDSKVRLDIQVN